MPMFNCAPFVADAVTSVLDQSFADFRFLIVDDGSTDGSGDIVAKLVASDPRVTLFRQDNAGIVASLTFLLSHVETPYVARMDGDDICLPGRFARQIAHMKAQPHLGALGTQFVEIDESGRQIPDDDPLPVGVGAVMAQLGFRQPICNPTTMFRRDALIAAGGYREAFRFCEDYDLFLRLSRIADIDNLPDRLLQYRRSPNQMSIRNNSRQTRQAVKALFAHREVLAGRRDPFDAMDLLPAVADMDGVFGRPGMALAMRAEIVSRLRFSPFALAGPEFDLICTHAASGAAFPGGWRTVARCLRLGLPRQALALAFNMTKGRLSVSRLAKGRTAS
ncbi:MAG: hypothetical protein RLZZ58_1510 [Pseudomonadota bacterium]